MNRSRMLVLVAPLAAALAGCGEAPKQAPPPIQPNAHDTSAAEPAAESTPQPSPAGDAGKTPAGREVTVAIKDFDGIQELVASKRGKVVVMDCWSTWCDPCVKEFPGLVELHKQYGPDDLACISLSFNYDGGKDEKPEDHVEQVLDFLRSKGATFDNVIASVPAEDLYKQLGFKSAAVPAIFVYDRQGNVARQFESGEAKYADVGKLVAELVESAPEASAGRDEE